MRIVVQVPWVSTLGLAQAKGHTSYYTVSLAVTSTLQLVTSPPLGEISEFSVHDDEWGLSGGGSG